MIITAIRRIDWLASWDASAGGHVYARDADLAFSPAGILYAGPDYRGPADRNLSGRGRLVLPGLVNVHCHSGDEPIAKGVFDDVGTAALWGNALYEFSTLLDADAEARAALLTALLGELMLSGCTTIVDLAGPHPDWLPIFARSGARGYLAPGFRQAAWRVADGHRLDYVWDEGAGRERFARALETVDAARAHPSGRLSGVLAPSQVETCREDLLADAADAARARGVPLTVHAAQTMAEHEELLRRTGLTAPRYLDRLGVLGPDLIIGHGIFLDHHSWTRQRTADDLTLLAEQGASVAHCPLTFARSGMTLQTLGRYRRAGVNVAMGTDSYPHNMLEEMRQALICARVAAGSVFDVSTRDVFEAATLGGARALGRSDIGRLAPGAKADFVVVDLDHPGMRPVRDPLRSLVHGAAERAVREVYVEGEAVVRDGRVVHLDYEGAVRELQAAFERAAARVPGLDSRGRDLDALAPLTLPVSSRQ
jgi:cytosine/adenosine deaminase-related metal-dependent hydrolase